MCGFQKFRNYEVPNKPSTMNEQLTAIRDAQRESWNKFSPGWKKWDNLTMDFLEPMGKAIIDSIRPADNDRILDIASGTGEPGLTIASMAKNGTVVLTDVSEKMLEVAKENADHRGIDNIEIVATDVSEMPFADESFDKISCRMGFMFFPDMQLAANEMARVLKKGGRIATSVWDGPQQNFWVTAIKDTIEANMQLDPPPPGSPGMFRCATPGLMKSIFEKAGFKNITESPVNSKVHAGKVDTYWNMMTEVAAPFVAALSKADDATRQKIREEVFAKVKERYPGEVNIDAKAIVISAEK
jgi:ubiquinone/menaquinone biosynthesis C-methylase UbiE